MSATFTPALFFKAEDGIGDKLVTGVQTCALPICHFKFELDLEVTAYGRNYNGKKVGPYLRMLEYDAGEVIIRQGDWEGNTFYVVVEGELDVYVASPEELARGELGTLYARALKT